MAVVEGGVLTFYVPRPYQPAITNHIFDNPRCNVFAGMGVGKSPATLQAISDLLLFGEVNRVLILAPKRVAQTTWPGEIANFRSSFGHLTLAVAVGTAEQRHTAVRSSANIVTINYDNLTWLIDNYGATWPFDMVVADECFPAGTKVQTAKGSESIESLKPGTKVLTRKGYRRVIHVFRKETKSLVEVRTINGACVVCTPGHCFWTTSGWKEAQDLGPTDHVYSRVQGVRASVCSCEESSNAGDAREVLWDSLSLPACDAQHALTVPPAVGEQTYRLAKGTRCMEQGCPDARGNEAEAKRRSSGARFGDAGKERGQRTRDECGGSPCGQTLGVRLDMESPDTHQGVRRTEYSDELQTRLCLAGPENLPGNRRAFAQGDSTQNAGCKEDSGFEWVRVASVSSVECPGGTPVFDLEVEGEHEYVAGGFLVHNCSRLKGLRVSLQTSKNGKRFLTGQGGKRSKALARVAISRVKRWVNLTGTPSPNGLEDLWGQCWFLDAGQRLGSSFTAFSHRWFRPAYGSTREQQRLDPLPFADEQIRAAIKDLTIAIEAKDHFDLPPLIENTIRVELPPAARKQYKEMERDLFTRIADHEIEAFSAGTASQKCLQIASGAAYTDDKGSWALVHDEKIEALKSVVEEAAGMPVLVAYHFKSDLARIMKAFPKAVHLGSDPSLIDRWNKGQIPILVAHPQSAGHGLSLQHGSNIIAFFSTNWNLEYDAQIIERLGPTRQAQSGYKRPVFLHRIVAAGTIEEVAVARLKSKASVQDALMEAMKKGR